MKKNFFKKLSFVLALAMIVSVLAPAAGAFAASAPKLNATTKYLYLGTDGNEYDFNIANKQTGWKYLWSSANEDVATVNEKNGEALATGAGKTTVSVVITDADGEEVDELTATVIVRDNIKELTITNTPVDGKLAIGVSNDFNRSYVTVAGKKTGTSGITRWSVSPSEGATISDAGLFTATVAGEYTITARAFQSKAKYASWLMDATKYASYVTSNEATFKVTVAASMVKAEQVDLDTVKVTFDSAVTDAATKLAVYNLIGTAEVTSTIKKVAMDSTNTVATVDMYVPFVEAGTVVVKYPNMTDVKFVAATSNASDVKTIEIATTTAELATSKTLAVKFLNKDGVDIAKSALYTRLTWATTNVATTVAAGSAPSLLMYKVGDTTTLTATFHTYTYDSTTGTETGNLTATQTVTCVDKSKDNAGTLNAYTVITAGSPDYATPVKSIAVGDAGKFLYVQLKGLKADGSTELLTSSATSLTGFKFTSSDTSVLNVIEGTGAVFAYKAGTAVVVVKYNDTVVGTATITVSAAREVATTTLDAYNFSISNDVDVQDVKAVTVTVKDQLAADYSAFSYVVALTSNNGTAQYVNGVYNGASVSGNKITLNFRGSDGVNLLADATYTYKITVKDNATSKELVSYVTVNLQKPTDQSVYYYAVETNASSYDMKLTSTDANEVVTVSVFGYATNGVRNVRLDAATAGLVLKNPAGTDISSKLTFASNNASLDLVPVTGGSVVAKLDKGTYTASVASGSVVAAAYFTVTDTQPAAVVTVNKFFTDKANNLDAVKDCISVKVGGTDVTASIVATGNTFYGEVVNGNNHTVFVKEVQYTETFGGKNVVHTIPVNATITYNFGN